MGLPSRRSGSGRPSRRAYSIMTHKLVPPADKAFLDPLEVVRRLKDEFEIVEHPLPDRDVREDVVDEMRGRVRHAPTGAGGADRPALSAEGHQHVERALGTADPGEA